MRDLFSDKKNVEAIPFTEYLKWVTPSENPEVFIALPPIQRGFVWKPAQIVNLWDSLFRGMPVGSLMLSELKKGKPYTAIINPENRQIDNTEHEKGYLLLDGQQRTLAMLLGWPGIECEERDRCIWIDLGKEGKKGSPFVIRLTTKSQPFGFEPSDPSRKLAISDRRKAREEFDESHPESEEKFDHQLNLNETRPWRATDYVLALPDLLAKWRNCKGQWSDSILCQLKVKPEDSEILQRRVELLGQAIGRIESMWIALILVPNFEEATEVAAPEDDSLVVLFERIADGGSRLTPDEHLFSLIKHRLPITHDIVNKMHGHTEISQLLKATDIVMTGVRIANIMITGKDKADPNANDFHSYLKNQKLTAEFERLIRGDNAPLYQAFVILNRLLEYRGNDNSGIPSLAMPLLGRQLVQVLLYWLIKTFQESMDNEKIQQTRDEILRFTLFWILCVNDANKASQVAFDFIAGNSPEVFPGQDIYKKLTEKNEQKASLALALVTPEDMFKAVYKDQSPILRTYNERFVLENNKSAGDLFARWWTSRKHLLLWLQRKHLAIIFSGYNPLAGYDDETPYDYDHICPRSHLLYHEYKSFNHDVKQALSEGWVRDLLINSIGNFRVWDSSLNRHDQTDSPKKKLKLQEKYEDLWQPTVQGRSRYSPKSAGELWDASMISQDDMQLWKDASLDENSNHWDDARIMAFQSAVESRTLKLYRHFYDDLKFGSWIKPKDTNAEDVPTIAGNL